MAFGLTNSYPSSVPRRGRVVNARFADLSCTYRTMASFTSPSLSFSSLAIGAARVISRRAAKALLVSKHKSTLGKMQWGCADCLERKRSVIFHNSRFFFYFRRFHKNTVASTTKGQRDKIHCSSSCLRNRPLLWPATFWRFSLSNLVECF